MSSLQIHLFKDSSKSFKQSLAESNIEFIKRPPQTGVVMAAGEIIEILEAVKGISPWGALAYVIATWIKAKNGRKVTFTTNENQIFHAEGYSVEEIEKLLKKSKNATIIEIPVKNNP